MSQERRSESPPKYGPYPGSMIAPNYPTESLPQRPYPTPPYHPSPPLPTSSVPTPPSPYSAPRHNSSAPYDSPRSDYDSRSPASHSTESSTYPSSPRHSTPPPRRSRRSRSPAEATYVCVDGVCTRLEPGTKTVTLTENSGRNLAGYLILAFFVMICFNICFGLFAVIFAREYRHFLLLSLKVGPGHILTGSFVNFLQL